MDRIYLLKMRFANGKPFSDVHIEKLNEELALFSETIKVARNPKDIISRKYNREEGSMDVKLKSSQALDYPGRSLAGLSRSLLTKYPEFKEGILGTSLFRIEVSDISNLPDRMIIDSYSSMMKILMDLLLESKDAKDRHKRDAVLNEIKELLSNNEYVNEQFGQK